MPSVEQELFSIAEVAKLLGVSRQHVRRLMDEKRLKAINLATKDSYNPMWRITRESVERLRCGK